MPKNKRQLDREICRKNFITPVRDLSSQPKQTLSRSRHPDNYVITHNIRRTSCEIYKKNVTTVKLEKLTTVKLSPNKPGMTEVGDPLKAQKSKSISKRQGFSFQLTLNFTVPKKKRKGNILDLKAFFCIYYPEISVTRDFGGNETSKLIGIYYRLESIDLNLIDWNLHVLLNKTQSTLDIKYKIRCSAIYSILLLLRSKPFNSDIPSKGRI